MFVMADQHGWALASTTGSLERQLQSKIWLVTKARAHARQGWQLMRFTADVLRSCTSPAEKTVVIAEGACELN